MFSDQQRRHLAHIYASLREHIWAEIEYDRTPDFAPLDREGEEAFWGHIDAALTSLMFAAHPEEAVALDTRCAAGLKPGSTAEPAEAPTSERQFVGEMGDLIGRYIDVQHDYETVLRGIGISAAYVLSNPRHDFLDIYGGLSRPYLEGVRPS